MGASQYFSASYAEARQKFRDAATAAGARLLAESNDRAKGPAGEALTTDLAWLGPADAKRVLVTVSATHGAEGFCGAGVQTGTFSSGVARELPPGAALLAVHAINPYGFAWIRRVTEDNVDLNRNFIAFGPSLPRNDDYDLLADAICPAEWTPAALAAAKARLDAFGERHGAAALQRAITGGQYRHADGVFYGGVAPVWSHRTRALRPRRAHRHPSGRERRLCPRAPMVRRGHHLHLARHLALLGDLRRSLAGIRAGVAAGRGDDDGARIWRAAAR